MMKQDIWKWSNNDGQKINIIATSFYLLSVNLVCLIKNNTDFIIMTTKRSNNTFELITDVEFMRIKQKKNKITLGSKPWGDTSKIIAALSSLFFSRQNSRGINKCNMF